MISAAAASAPIAAAQSQADGPRAALQRVYTVGAAVEEGAKTKNMSVVVKRGINAKAESRKCAARLWRLFPHVLLCLSLVAYAALGALLFQHIEGESASTTQQDYRLFLGQIVGSVQNFTGKVEDFFF